MPYSNHHHGSEQIQRMPVLQYVKEPAEKLYDLYLRYPDGGEYGWFTFIYELKTFAYWDTYKKEWSVLDVANIRLDAVADKMSTTATYADGTITGLEEGGIEGGVVFLNNDMHPDQMGIYEATDNYGTSGTFRKICEGTQINYIRITNIGTYVSQYDGKNIDTLTFTSLEDVSTMAKYRVRFDHSQELTETQENLARSNIKSNRTYTTSLKPANPIDGDKWIVNNKEYTRYLGAWINLSSNGGLDYVAQLFSFDYFDANSEDIDTIFDVNTN